jgi:hypothetical protein
MEKQPGAEGSNALISSISASGIIVFPMPRCPSILVPPTLAHHLLDQKPKPSIRPSRCRAPSLPPPDGIFNLLSLLQMTLLHMGLLE